MRITDISYRIFGPQDGRNHIKGVYRDFTRMSKKVDAPCYVFSTKESDNVYKQAELLQAMAQDTTNWDLKEIENAVNLLKKNDYVCIFMKNFQEKNKCVPIALFAVKNNHITSFYGSRKEKKSVDLKHEKSVHCDCKRVVLYSLYDLPKPLNEVYSRELISKIRAEKIEEFEMVC